MHIRGTGNWARPPVSLGGTMTVTQKPAKVPVKRDTPDQLTPRSRRAHQVLSIGMLGVAALIFVRTPGKSAYPWPIVLPVLLVTFLVMSRPHAAIGGPRGSSVEAGATGTVLLAAVVLLPPVALPVLCLPTALLSSRRWEWRLWNTGAHALGVSAAALAFWSLRPTGWPPSPARYVVAVSAAAVAYYLIEQVAFTWLQTRLHTCTIRETGLWSREAVSLDVVLLGSGVTAGTLVLTSPWMSGLAVVVLVAVMQLLDALDRAHDGYLDAKTGLLQLPAFTRWATRALSSADRSGRPAAVVMIDLDHFRGLNTLHGHQAGDRMLIEVASLLRATIRSTDLAGRYGGEEFVVLLSDTEAQEAVLVAERIRVAIGEVVLTGARGAIRVTASIGVAAWAPGRDIATLITAADDALYRAKSSGRNRTVVTEAT
jgi:diguanylate cyclase (GGDEF)-like protein